MGEVAKINPGEIEGFQPRILELIKRTVASDCNDDEFRTFIHMARQLELDPLRKQIYAFVFSKNNPKKRRMSIVTGIDGFRTIAARQGDYRPDEEAPTFKYSEQLKDPEKNPLGIESASVRVFKQDNQNTWNPINGTVYWDEFAPLKEVWAYDEASGKDKPTGKFLLDTSGNWGKMPRVMIAKCAEAQALRRGWPDDLSNVYEQSEIDQARVIDLDPIDAIETSKREYRQARIGGPAIMVAFEISDPLRGVPAGELADRAIEHVETLEASAKVEWFQNVNQEAFRQLWAHDADAALSLKKVMEKRYEALKTAEMAAE